MSITSATTWDYRVNGGASASVLTSGSVRWNGSSFEGLGEKVTDLGLILPKNVLKQRIRYEKDWSDQKMDDGHLEIAPLRVRYVYTCDFACWKADADYYVMLKILNYHLSLTTSIWFWPHRIKPNLFFEVRISNPQVLNYVSNKAAAHSFSLIFKTINNFPAIYSEPVPREMEKYLFWGTGDWGEKWGNGP